MLELNINPRSPSAITAAFKKIREMVMTGAIQKTTPIHLVLESGTYRETVMYNLTNPLTMESAPGSRASDCVITADNCEAFHKGVEGRAVFVMGPNVKQIVLKNFSIINSHKKSIMEGNALGDSAEAFVWNSTSGSLECEGMKFESSQNTLALKGNCWFRNCTVVGDVDFIYGDVETAFFENSTIRVKEDYRGDFPGYAVRSGSVAGKKGFVFSGCTFECDKRKKSNVYIGRTEGKGSASSKSGWDNIALIRCKVSEEFHPEYYWDDDMELEVYPRGNAKNGFREYKTVTVMNDGSVAEADTSRRNIKSYTMTDDDFFANYASRFLILQGTIFEDRID